LVVRVKITGEWVAVVGCRSGLKVVAVVGGIEMGS